MSTRRRTRTLGALALAATVAFTGSCAGLGQAEFGAAEGRGLLAAPRPSARTDRAPVEPESVQDRADHFSGRDAELTAARRHDGQGQQGDAQADEDRDRARE